MPTERSISKNAHTPCLTDSTPSFAQYIGLHIDANPIMPLKSGALACSSAAEYFAFWQSQCVITAPLHTNSALPLTFHHLPSCRHTPRRNLLHHASCCLIRPRVANIDLRRHYHVSNYLNIPQTTSSRPQHTSNQIMPPRTTPSSACIAPPPSPQHASRCFKMFKNT